MDFSEWLHNKDGSTEINPYLSLIRRISGLDNSTAKEKIIDDLRKDKLSKTETEIVHSLLKENRLTKNSIFIAAIRSNCPLNKITSLISWVDFEKLTGEIFHYAHWEVQTNFRYFGEGGQTRNRKRFEVDVLAWKKPFVLLIDNKRHANTSKSYLADAVEKQQTRSFELFEMIPIIHDLPEIQWSKKWEKAILMPLIVTWRDHGLIDIANTPIVPSNHLIDLLNNIRIYFDERKWFHLIWEKI